MIRRRVLLVCVLALAPLVAPAAEPPAALDATVARAMAAFEVPGVAVAIVRNGEVVLARGYGVRRLGAPEAVDAHTRFGIASNTKVFTAVALGTLVEEGKVEWDAPVTRYLPWFEAWDPCVTRQLTVRDLLVHRSGLGLGAGDLLWWPQTTYTRREIVRRLRHLRPATSFRSGYAYDNVLYIVAGEVIEAVSGLTWEAFVEGRILAKAGMRDATVRHSDAEKPGNVAATHAPVEGAVRPVAPMLNDATNAAGGINASAADMARWMQVLLAGGRLPDGGRLYGEGTARELTTVVTPVRVAEVPPELAVLRPMQRGYALGLNVLDFRGHLLVTHTGGLPGYVSRVALLPDERVGVAVLTNQEAEEAHDAIAWSVLDAYLGADSVDWVDAYAKARTRRQSAPAAAPPDTQVPVTAKGPSLPLPAYAGRYDDAWYGSVRVDLEDGRLVVRFLPTPVLVGDAEHRAGDTFLVRWRDRSLRADAYLTFALSADGRRVVQATMRAASPDTDFSYDFQDLLLRPTRRK